MARLDLQTKMLVGEIGRAWPANPNAQGDEARTLRPLHSVAITCRIVNGQAFRAQGLDAGGCDVAARGS